MMIKDSAIREKQVKRLRALAKELQAQTRRESVEYAREWAGCDA